MDSSEQPAGRISAELKTTLWLLLFSTLFRLFFAARLGLGDAEAYYWSWSRNLALSYYDHPPMVSWLIRLVTLPGDHPLFVRLASLLLFNGVALLAWDLTRRISGSRQAGLVCVVLLHLIPAFFIGGMTATPDIPLAFFWLLSIDLLYRGVTSDRPALFVLSGVAVGFAFLSKYFAILLPLTFLVYLAHPDRRAYLKRIWPWAGALLALAFTLVVILWNMQHNWASTRYHLVARHSSFGPSFNLLGKVIGGQIGYITPLFLYFFIDTLVWLRKKKREHSGAQLLFWTSLIPLVVLGGISSMTHEAEPHWPVMAYLPLCLALAWRWVEMPIAEKFQPKIQRLKSIAVWYSLILTGLFLLHTSTPIFVKLVPQRFYQPKVDITNELYGWSALAKEVDRLQPKQRAAFIMSYHYTMCGQLNHATRNRYPVLCPNNRLDQFDFMTDEKAFWGKSGLFVGDNRYRRTPQEAVHCSSYRKVSELIIRRGKIPVRTYLVWRCDGFRGPKPKPKKKSR